MSGRIVVLGGASEVGLAIAAGLVAQQPAEVVLAGRRDSAHRDAALAQAAEWGGQPVVGIGAA
ncbi:MAG: hypothetical protein Q4G46_16535, partial [Propionibacteriaceae bacterium]|nr:hypothetical protein [Propionibacteriaceae bacterium]